MPVNLLFDRPTLGQTRNALAIYIDGLLPIGLPGAAYEGRLQIHNNIGNCTVEQIDGDALPPGHAIFVDNVTSEIVITWPEFVATERPVFNGDFEGGVTGWRVGAGWSVNVGGGNDVQSGTHSAVFRGPGESLIEGQVYYPVDGSTPPFSATLRVQQGASDAGAAGAGVGVQFYDIDRNPLISYHGSFLDSGSHGNWGTSSGSFVVPAGAAFVTPFIRGIRYRQNHALYADDFAWTLQGEGQGVNETATYNLTLQVTDSAGRSAIWDGTIFVFDGDIPYTDLSRWKFFYTFTPGWADDYSQPSYDDSSWPEGAGGFGFNTPDGAQEVNTGTDRQDGAKIWLRKRVELPTIDILVEIWCDDGAMFWWNGEQLVLTPGGSYYQRFVTIPAADVTGDDLAVLRVIDCYLDDGVTHSGSPGIYASMTFTPV